MPERRVLLAAITSQSGNEEDSDAERPTAPGACPQQSPCRPSPCRPNLACRRTTAVLALALATLAAFTVARQMGGGVAPAAPAVVEIPTDASQKFTHSSEFGEAPHSLKVSGVACPGDDQPAMNGVYSFGGLTGEGRPYYTKHANAEGWYGEPLVLFYDQEWDGEAKGKDNRYGAWFFGFTRGFHSERKEQFMEVDMGAFAFVNVEKGCTGHPQDLNQKAGAAPPTDHKWKVYCKGVGWTYHQLKIKPSDSVHAAPSHFDVVGHWQYRNRYTSGKEEITMTHGMNAKSNKGGEFSLGGNAGGEVGASAKIAGEEGVFGFEKVSGEAESHFSLHAEVQAENKDIWARETTLEDKVERKIPVPSDRHCLWQYILTAQGQHDSADVLTDQFVFTASGLSPPKCYPRGCVDDACQQCHSGWELA